MQQMTKSGNKKQKNVVKIRKTKQLMSLGLVTKHFQQQQQTKTKKQNKFPKKLQQTKIDRNWY